MPSLAADLHQPAEIQRETFELGTVSFSGNAILPLVASRADPFFMALVISLTTGIGSGNVRIEGQLDGDNKSQTIVFNGAGDVRVIGFDQQLDTVQDLNITLPSQIGTLTLQAVSRTGQPSEALTTIASNVLCKVTRERFGGLQQSSTEAAIDSARIFFFPGQALSKKDIIVVDGDRWRVKGIQESFNLRTGFADLKTAIVFNEEQS